MFWFVIIAVFGLDLVTKFLVQANMELGQSIPIVEGIFHLTYVLNPGAAFGMLAYKTTFFIVTTVIVLSVIGYIYYKSTPDQRLLRFALGLQVGGALGNFLDRLRTGYVIDFFDFRVWPVFNIADIAISVGVALLLWEIYRSEKEDKNKEEHIRE